ncbi:MAG: M23 family metallopeptidase [Lachnospiraceae bacterium]|nr:M23 family metallopeptidase [Lachnospiraceae bacterium]
MKYGFWVILFCALLLPSYKKLEYTGANTYEVFLNGTSVGKLEDEETAKQCLKKARRELNVASDELVLAGTDLTFTAKEEIIGILSDEADVIKNMKSVIERDSKETMERAYTVKIGQYSINLESTDAVIELLQAALDKYQDDEGYTPVLDLDKNRELTVLKPSVYKEDTKEDLTLRGILDSEAQSGIAFYMEEALADIEPSVEKDFADYEQGITGMDFKDSIEVVECYLPNSELTPIETAIKEVTEDKATPTIYEVASGDTLSEISEKVNIPMDDIIAMNDSVENEFSTLQIGQELTITIPKPKLAVKRTVQKYYEEDYEAEIIYVDNDEWYTTDMKTLQEPSAGHHNVMALITYINDDETEVEYLKEDVTYEAVAKIVERGTKIPPTYIKPISGGRLSSGFGRRKAPKAGASTYHKGVDWATATGTPVYASSGGVVAKAGWGSGYGYVVYINHPDGRQTRYGHLSRVLVSAGQSVSQGQRIALSGNTGVSTGPHLHFEILINGTQVNPLNYLN